MACLLAFPCASAGRAQGAAARMATSAARMATFLSAILRETPMPLRPAIENAGSLEISAGALAWSAALEEGGGEFDGLQRFAEEKALALVAAALAQVPELDLALHAFGDHREPQAVRHGDDDVHEHRRAPFGADTRKKGTVDLELVQRQLLQIAQ